MRYVVDINLNRRPPLFATATTHVPHPPLRCVALACGDVKIENAQQPAYAALPWGLNGADEYYELDLNGLYEQQPAYVRLSLSLLPRGVIRFCVSSQDTNLERLASTTAARPTD